MTAGLLTADPADSDDAELLALGVVVEADDVVAAFEFVGTMAVVVVGLARVLAGKVGAVGSTVVMPAAAGGY